MEFHLYLYGPSRGPLETSFEAAQQRLEQLDRLYFEPDGSFVCSRPPDEQLFGMLYDAFGQIQYVELRGRCHLALWHQIRDAITDGKSDVLEVLRLPNQQLQELQEFEKSLSNKVN